MKNNVTFKLMGTILSFLLMGAYLQAQDLTLPEGMVQLTPTGVEVTNVMPFANPASPQALLPVSTDFIIFGARTAELGAELWITNKTAQSTRLLKDINPGTNSSNPGGYALMGGKVYFKAETPENGAELWVTDGTEAGTKMLVDIYPGVTGSGPGGLVVLGNKILFTAMDEESELLPVVDPTKKESWLWVTDGTVEGTVRIADVPLNSYIEVCGNKAFFAATDLTNNMTLWVTDGTKAGTKVLKNINNKPATGTFATESAAIGALRNVNDKWVVFRAETVKEQVGEDYGSEIWMSDGTTEGTKWLGHDFAKGMRSGKPTATQFAIPVAFGDTLYFRSDDGVHGVEPCVWYMNQPIVEGVNPRQFFDVNHWGGAVQYDSWPSEFFPYQGYLFMQVNGGYYMPGDATQYASGYSLWLTPLEERLDTCIYQRQFWGKEIAAGSLTDGCASFTKVTDKLFFKVLDEANNTELWVVDNISTFPRKVVDLPGNGNPGSFINIDQDLYFTSYGVKSLFRYNVGSATGTKDVKSLPEVTVYPTNASDRIEIKSAEVVKSVEIYNVSGQLVMQKSNVTTLDVNTLNGMYLVKVLLANGEQSIHKISVK
ncbi:MAG: ELWxxDGT repeat protein [Paludibacter sp.]|nr:ELWxxDGT repeat protein [Paludibacter sp.]